MRKFSISAASSESSYSLEFKQALASKVQRLKDKVKVTGKTSFDCEVFE